jgi:hypothetical protein
MPDIQGAMQDGPRDARIVEEHHVTGPHGEDEIEGIEAPDGGGTTSGRSLPAAPTSWASTPRGGWRWAGSS